MLQKKGLKKLLPLALVLLFFIAFKLYVLRQGAFTVHGDNALYMYMARQMSRGVIPYRDFFFGHPILTILPTAALIKVFGTSFMVGMIQPIFSGLASIILVYLIGEKIRGGSGIYAAAFLATSYHFQFFTHWLGGVALSVVFVLASFYLTLQKRHELSAAFLVLSFLTRINHFPVLFVFLGYHLYKKNYRFFKGLVIAGLASFILFLIPGYVDGTILYHFLKKAGPLSVGHGAYFSVIQKQAVIITLSLLSFAYIFKRKIKDDALFFSYAAALSCLTLLALSELRTWYVLYTIPFFCILAGFLMHQLSLIKVNKKHISPIVIAAFLILLVLNIYPAYGFTQYSEPKSYDPVYDLLDIQEGDYLLDTLAGISPYLALKNDAFVAGDLVDMNPLRFASGLIDIDDTIMRLEAQPPKYIFDMRGGTGELVSWDHYWRFTPLRDYIYNKYNPHYLVYNDDLFTLTLIWEKTAAEPIPDFQVVPAIYDIKFLDKHEIVNRRVDTHYLTTQRASNASNLELTNFVDALTKLTISHRQLIAHNAWNFSNPHNIVEDGSLRSETWITPHDGHYLVFTETTDNNITVSITAMDLLPEQGYWLSLTIYENILGGLIPTYSEQLVRAIG